MLESILKTRVSSVKSLIESSANELTAKHEIIASAAKIFIMLLNPPVR